MQYTFFKDMRLIKTKIQAGTELFQAQDKLCSSILEIDFDYVAEGGSGNGIGFLDGLEFVYHC